MGSFEEVRSIRFVSTNTVRPAGRHEDGKLTPRIELTPSDLRALRRPYIQNGLLFTHPKPHLCKQELINRLKTSLSNTLDHFFPLAGRLAITKHEDATISFHINCNSAGAEFIHAIADNVTIADVLDSTYVPQILIDSFFTLYGVCNCEGQSQPLLSIQVTELVDGIFLGCSMNHTVCDGSSFWHFINLWSEICRDGSSHCLIPPSSSPSHRRWFPENIECPIPIRLPFSGDQLLTQRGTTATTSFEERIFYFTRKNMEKLKAKANNSEIISTRIIKDNHGIVISSLQALLAHVWVAVIRAGCFLDPSEETRYMLTIGNRARLNPPLPETYFGNSVLSGVATTKVGELLEWGLGYAAMLLNKAIMSYNDATIRSYWQSWVNKPVIMSIDDVVSPSTLVSGPSLTFNIFGNDFGWGQPIAMRSGLSDKFNGKISVVPGPVEGIIAVEACLSLEVLKALANDSKFMKFVTLLPPFLSV